MPRRKTTRKKLEDIEMDKEHDNDLSITDVPPPSLNDTSSLEDELMYKFTVFVRDGNLAVDFHYYKKDTKEFFAWRDIKKFIESDKITLQQLKNIDFAMNRAVTEVMASVRKAAKRGSSFNINLFERLLALYKRDGISSDGKSFHSEIQRLIILMQEGDDLKPTDQTSHLKNDILYRLGG